jgi:hypothetical protein
MKIHLRSSSLGITAMLVAMCGYASAQASPDAVQLISANATLIHTLDSKNATQGEAISAKLTSNVKNAGTVEFPKGTMLIGKVDQVQPSNGDGPAKLSIVFDQARFSDGKVVPIKATLLGAYPGSAGEYYADLGTQGALLEGQPHLVSADSQIDQEPGTLGNVEMHSAVKSDASAVFTSKDRNINLKSGTIFQIAVAPEGAATAQQSGN